MLTTRYLTTLVLALAASMPVFGYEIQIRRFHTENCTEPIGEEHGSKVYGPGVHIPSGHCINFDHHKGPHKYGFLSYSFHHGGLSHHMHKTCDIVVYPERGCIGHELKGAGDINDGGQDYFCHKTGGEVGRSVLVDCIDRIDR